MSEEQENQTILPAPGTYKARRTGTICVRETDKGALCAYIPYQLLGSSVAYCGEHVLTLNGQDGNEMKFNWDNIYNVMAPLGWQPNADDKMNPYDLKSVPLTPEGTAEFIAKDCFHDEYNGKKTFKIRFFNALSGKEISAEEEQVQVAKWEVKFPSFAAFAKKPAAKTEVAKPAPVAEPVAEVAAPAEPVAKKPAGRKSPAKVAAKVWNTSEEVYTALLKKEGADADAKKEEHVADKIWYPACDAVCGDNVQPTTPEQFTAIAEKLGL